MDPHLLRTFTTVARLGSFSAAARELGYTQSAVSQHIAALEADLGVELLGRRPVVATEAGARLLDHAGPLLTRLAAARADVVRVGRTPAARLVVGATALAFGPRAARALGRVRAAMPRTDVVVRLLDREVLMRGVAEGELGAALVDGAAAPTDPLRLPEAAGLVTNQVAEEPLTVLLPPGHPLSDRAGLRLPDLADALWLDAPGAAVRLAELRAATGGAFPGQVCYDGTDARALHALVAAGQGLAVLPRSVAGAGGVPVTGPRLVHRVEVVRATSPDPVAALFAQALVSGSGTR
ncbi:LysR family transcriptional regulator [Streptomyces sp. NBC_01476]|uniref:LysR family transcriptional regulator n=1 Tax=Streptomyces sp. NBC_01476 TaxID=2903881 RepID=UPI002E32C4D7|nr:LysR family transcriptional regulator [Streptomyces sp. NBC_01476]